MTPRNSIAYSDSSDLKIIIIAGGIVLAISFGIRSIFGGIIDPLSAELFDGKIEIFSLSIAIQNLVWGIAQPGFGMIADKYGDRKALWLGFFFYLLGLTICALAMSPITQHLGAGVFVGMGISGTAFGTVLAVVGRNAPEEKRSQYLGFTSAIGSSGQVIFPFLASWLTEWLDWRLTVAVIILALIPMALCIFLLKSGTSTSREIAPKTSIVQTIRDAFGHSSYVLLTIGFFVCGFHLAFITAHFPNFVQNFCLSPATSGELRALGLQAISLAGLANIVGTLVASRLGAIYPKPYILATIYALRAIAIMVFISNPITPTSVILFAVFMGGIWLSTVPLTSAMVLVMFGPRAMGTLFGFVFLSHQLGSFAGVWLGGLFYDWYASYDQIWYIAIVLSIFSALSHLLVRECEAPSYSAVLNK